MSGGDERRTFRKWEATTANAETGALADPGPVSGETYTFNSTELRAVGLELDCSSLWLQLVVHRSGWWHAFGVLPQQLVMQHGGACQGWHRRCTSSWHHSRKSCL